MNQHLVQITVCLPSEVHEYAQNKNERTGETIDRQLERAMVLMQMIEMILNGAPVSSL
jgi:hypothetical protein